MDFSGEHIFLVEDDQTLNFIIRDNLEQNGYKVTAVDDGQKAIDGFEKDKFSICILDVMLPKKDGFTVAREIRKKDDHVPVIFLTAKSMTEDRINGLSIGGDDYITKPFSMEELLLRIKVFLKRSQKPDNADGPPVVRKIGAYNFYFENLILEHGDKRKTLTYKEAELLKYFCENPNKILSRSEILMNVWGSDDYYLGRSLDVFISRLRRYLKDDPDIKILNLHGIGFRFNTRLGK
ncbi:MAG: response regulator transcription factor [Prolixibacteraceae bacterium]|jgi:DNA-binding response OmpR family regulator|nr:response regulator transcription factor [Prolixibacteraceae bacterium]